MSALLDRDAHFAIEQFLLAEANLLDSSEWLSWQALFTVDGTYWMPLSASQTDPINHVSLIFDDRTLMELKCRRLHAADPASSLSLHPFPKTLRYLTNISVRTLAQDAYEARANILAVQHASVATTQLYAKARWELVPQPSGFLIRRKRVDLLTAGTALSDILVYL